MRKINSKSIMLMLLVGVFTIGFLIVIGRFMYIQVGGEVHSVDLVNYSEKYRNTGSQLAFERGQILDRTGMVLADNMPAYKMYAITRESYSENSPVPLHVVDAKETAEKIAPYLDKDPADIERIIQNGIDEDRFQVEFGKEGSQLTEEVAEEIQALDLPGINFERHSVRYYPNGPFASHILGYTAENDDQKMAGALGVELEWDEYLQGEEGFIRYQRDKYGYKLLNADEVVQQPKDGDHIYLTIDQKIQTFLEDALSTVQEEYNPERMFAVVMNPKTGEILAMSNRPTFDPNEPDNITNWYNDIIAYPFEPGSTMKIFTVAAAMEEGVYNGDETFESGEYRINENFRPINDYNNRGWGEITYDEGVQRSSNVVVAKLLWEKIGADVYEDYLKAFHFDRKTGIDLSNERIGRIVYEQPMEKLTVAYGQGSTFTPIQIAKAATAIANDGEMVKPYIISHVTDSESNQALYQSEPEVVGQPISEETAAEMRDLLETVVTTEHGTGRSFRLDRYTSLGKTGTAQIPDPDTGFYMTGPGDYVFSYIGMAPKDDPELLMFVAVKQPEIEHYTHGSRTTSYIYKTVMENSLNYLNVTPDQDSIEVYEPIEIENVVGQSVEDVEAKFNEHGVTLIQLGEGETINEVRPAEGEGIYPNGRLIVQTEGEVSMLDLTDWPLRDVLHFSEMLNLDLDFLGSGYVTEQSIKPGATVQEGDRLVVELKSRVQEFEEQKDEVEENVDEESDED